MVRASIAIVLIGCGTQRALPPGADAAMDSTTGADAIGCLDGVSPPIEVGFDAGGDVAAACEPARPPEDVGVPTPCGPSGECFPKTLVCVNRQCVSHGSLGAPCMLCIDGTWRWCAPGLSCDGERCTWTLPSGAACANDPVVRCPPGEACLFRDGYLRCARVLTIANGAPCRPESYGERCADGSTCVVDASRSTCRRIGALGGPCREYGFPCDEGECHWLTAWSSTCATVVPDGTPCDPYGRTSLCRGGATCSPSSSGFVCLPNGSAPGGPCLSEPLLCRAPLTCVRSHCVRDVVGNCEPRVPSDRCPTNSVCAARDPDNGRCVAPVTKSVDRQLVALPAAVALPLTSGPPECVDFDVTCSASLYVEINDGMGTRFASGLQLKDASGRDVIPPFTYGTNLLTGALHEGRHTLCVSIGMWDRTQYLDLALVTGGEP